MNPFPGQREATRAEAELALIMQALDWELVFDDGDGYWASDPSSDSTDFAYIEDRSQYGMTPEFHVWLHLPDFPDASLFSMHDPWGLVEFFVHARKITMKQLLALYKAIQKIRFEFEPLSMGHEEPE